jgi:hypothetical protein
LKQAGSEITEFIEGISLTQVIIAHVGEVEDEDNQKIKKEKLFAKQ